MMKKAVPLIISLLSAYSIAGIANAEAANPAEARGESGLLPIPALANSSASSNAAANNSAVDDTSTHDDNQVRTTARRRPSPNLRQRPAPHPPVPAPSPPPGRGIGLGRFFGGVAAGALLGTVFSSMLHPFGGFGMGFSLIGLLLDAVLLFLAFKLFRRIANRNYGR